MKNTTPTTKICYLCKIEQSIENFSKNKSKKDGLSHKCKGCVNLYYIANKEYINDACKKYRNENKYSISERVKKYGKENSEKLSRVRSKKYLLNREKVLLKASEYYFNNKDKVKQYRKDYYYNGNGKSVAKNSEYKRRCLKKEGDVTNNQLMELEQNAKTCYWCNEPLKNKVIHIDHYIPLSKGGEHTLSNLVVSCDKCNRNKSAKDPIKFAQSIGKLF